MAEENEVIVLVLGIILFVFLLRGGKRIKNIPGWKRFFLSYTFLLAGWAATVIESFALNTVFNLIEHICYTFSSIFLLFWCISLLKESKRENSV